MFVLQTNSLKHRHVRTRIYSKRTRMTINSAFKTKIIETFS